MAETPPHMANLSEEEVVVHDDCIIEQYFDDVQDLRLIASYDEDDQRWEEDGDDQPHGSLLSFADDTDGPDDNIDSRPAAYEGLWRENEGDNNLLNWEQNEDIGEVHRSPKKRQQVLNEYSNYYSTTKSRRRRRRSRRMTSTRLSIPRSSGDKESHQSPQQQHLSVSRTKWGRFRPQRKVVDSVLELIGNTPLVRLRRVVTDTRTAAYDQLDNDSTDEAIAVQAGCEVLLKLDYDNPSNSIKDRVAIAMIEEAEKTHGITAQTTVLVEAVAASSANIGIALAMVAATKGYHLILATPQSLAMERRVLLRAYGAEIVLTSASRGLGGAIAKAEEIVEEMNDPSKTNQGNIRGYLLRQFSNEHNVRVHRETTGPEIWEGTEGDVDIVVGGVGTGGTLVGIAQYLKTLKPEVQIVAVEPTESPVLTREVFKSALASDKPAYASEHGPDDDEDEVDYLPTHDRPRAGQWQNFEGVHFVPKDTTNQPKVNRRQFLALSKTSLADGCHRSSSALLQPREGVQRKKASRRPSLIEQASNGSNSDAGGDGIVGPHKIQGIGLGFLPETMDVKMVDEIITVSSDEAMEMARRVCRLEGICCGISSGATIAAAVRRAQRPSSRNKTIVVIVASQGERYLSTSLYKNVWDEVTRLRAEPLVRDNCSQVVPILHNNSGKDSGRSITTATTATTTTTIPPPSLEESYYYYGNFTIDGGDDDDGGRGLYREEFGRKRPNGVKFQRRRSSTASLGSHQAD